VQGANQNGVVVATKLFQDKNLAAALSSRGCVVRDKRVWAPTQQGAGKASPSSVQAKGGATQGPMGGGGASGPTAQAAAGGGAGGVGGAQVSEALARTLQEVRRRTENATFGIR
jgi:uncharacterized membrane protein